MYDRPHLPNFVFFLADKLLESRRVGALANDHEPSVFRRFEFYTYMFEDNRACIEPV